MDTTLHCCCQGMALNASSTLLSYMHGTLPSNSYFTFACNHIITEPSLHAYVTTAFENSISQTNLNLRKYASVHYHSSIGSFKESSS